MEDDYVTFEQAKVLKELGFPQWEESKYPYYDGYSFDGKETSVISSNCKMEYSKVPLSLVQKWLRKEKNIHLIVDRIEDNIGKDYTWKICGKTPIFGEAFGDEYEEALSAGIDKAIEILKQTK